ncbi:MAG: PepSY domain-containing protein [Oceanicaulis sp.]|nr:PepSY domain-containing protein [Oceanicaulis sp.]
MIAGLRAWHRTGPQVAAAVAVIWGVSGLLHPVMNWTAPRAALQAPPAFIVETEGAHAPSVFPGPASGVRQVRLAPSPLGAYWNILSEAGQPRAAYDPATGEDAAPALEAHAIALARHYASLPQADVLSVRQITRFSLDYPPVNRLLPVTEVMFDTPGRLTIYADTGSDRLAAVSNTPRRWMLRIFQTLHTLAPLKAVEPVRLAVLTALTLAFMSTVIAGLLMLGAARGRKLRRWHRWAGAVLALPALAFPASGLFHAWTGSSLFDEAPAQAERFDIAGLAAFPAGRFSHLAATQAGGALLWRGADGEGTRYWSAHGEALDADEPARARMLTGAPPSALVSLQSRFDAEYGFVNKRLPVWRVETPDGPVFADPVDALIAGRPGGGVGEAERWSFNQLHKWQFANLLGRDVRDALMMLAAAAIIALAITGLSLRRRRKGKPPEP